MNFLFLSSLTRVFVFTLFFVVMITFFFLFFVTAIFSRRKCSDCHRKLSVLTSFQPHTDNLCEHCTFEVNKEIRDKRF